MPIEQQRSAPSRSHPYARRLTAALAIGTASASAAMAAGNNLVLFVDDDAPPGGDGLSWETAFNTIEAGVDALSSIYGTDFGVEWRLAQGTYVPANPGGFPFLFGDSSRPLQIIGGFAGLGTPDPDARKPKVTRTVFSGDVLGNDPPLDSTTDRDDPRFDDNAVMLVNIGSGPDQTVIDGITFTRAETALVGIPATLRDSSFTGNLSAALTNVPSIRAGSTLFGIFESGITTKTVSGCDFDANIGIATVFLQSSGPFDSDARAVVFDRCRFRRNVGTSAFGVVALTELNSLNDERLPVIVFNQTTFVGNTTIASDGYQWGAYAAFRSSNVRFYNSLFYGNRVPLGDGAAHLLLNGSIREAENRAVMQNCVLWNNASEFGNGPNGSIPKLTDTVMRSNIIQGWDRPNAIRPFFFDVEEGILDTDPLFVDPYGPDGVLGTDDDDFTPAPGSPLVDAGTAVSLPGELRDTFLAPWEGSAGTFDLAGKPRIIDDGFAVNNDTTPIDIGPFELQPADADRDRSGAHDGAQIAADPMLDRNSNGRIDSTEPFIDCDGNGTLDSVDIALNPAFDCDGDGILDACQIAADPALDADDSGSLDACEPATFFVDDDADAGGDGSSWASALTSVDDALAIAAARAAATEIRVAQGTYIPHNDRGRYASFELSPGLRLLGGYAGVGAPNPDARDPLDYETILSGLLGPGNDGEQEYTFHVLTARGFLGRPGAVVEGFTIRDGFARSVTGEIITLVLRSNPNGDADFFGFGRADFGPALHAAASSVTLRACRFENLAATTEGFQNAVAGVGQSLITLEACDFTALGPNAENPAGKGRPGAIVRQPFLVGSRSDGTEITWDASRAGRSLSLVETIEGSITIQDITSDHVGELGTLLDAAGLRPTVTLKNVNLTATDISGGVLQLNRNQPILGSLDLLIDGCDIEGNSLEFDTNTQDPESNINVSIFRSRIDIELFRIFRHLREVNLSLAIDRSVLNKMLVRGDGESDSVVITNSVLTDPPSAFLSIEEVIIANSHIGLLATEQDVAPPIVVDTESALLANNLIAGIDRVAGPDGLDLSLNAPARPGTFVDPIGPDGEPNTGDEDYRLAVGSPAIDAGDNAFVPIGVTTDLAGNPRFIDDTGTPDTGFGIAPIVDIGPYEFTGTSCPGDIDGDGDVGTADLLTLLKNFNGPATRGDVEGDLDNSGTVDTADLLTLLAVFNTSC